MRHASTLGILLILAASSLRTTAAQVNPPPIDMAAASAPVAAAVARAGQVIQELQTTLVGRLNTALTAGGPAAAVQVCRDEAQLLTRALATKHDVAIGRTSHKLRNPSNAPRPWAAATVAANAGRTLAEASPAVFDLGGRVGVLRPIGTLDFCVTCHGPRQAVDAAIGQVLRTAYPQDQAVGFAPGDLRGWAWAEVALD
jgi:hypothetical protein